MESRLVVGAPACEQQQCEHHAVKGPAVLQASAGWLNRAEHAQHELPDGEVQVQEQHQEGELELKMGQKAELDSKSAAEVELEAQQEPEPEPEPEREPEAEKESEPEGEPETDAAALNAQFLMQASFGPTRGSVAELARMTHVEWMQEQMNLPVESHREYYRERVQPRTGGSVGTSRKPCDVGSRWVGFTFSQADVGKRVHVNAEPAEIFVNGVFRTSVAEGPTLPSSWAGLAGDLGNICLVDERVGGDVHVSKDPCNNRRKTVRVHINSAIWLSSAREVSVQPFANLTKFSTAAQPDVQVLEESHPTCGSSAEVGLGWHFAPEGATECDYGATASMGDCEKAVATLSAGLGQTPKRGLQTGFGGRCKDGAWGNVPLGCSSQTGGDYTGHFKASGVNCNAGYQLVCSGNTGAPPIIKLGVDFYRFESRMELLSNTPKHPATSGGGSCLPSHFMNERDCRLQPIKNITVEKVQGLSVSVYEGRDFPSSKDLGQPVKTLISETVNYASTRGKWPGFPLGDSFAVRWTGEIKVATSGKYDFFLESDDGSRLEVDRKLVIDNGGYHGMRERAGSKFLDAGDHEISIEFFEGGGGAGCILRWKDPGSGGSKKVVPRTVFSTTKIGGVDCLVSCGSPGEVANKPTEGHVLPMVLSSRRRILVDRRFDNRYFRDMFSSDLGKTTVWTAKALGANDQLRQRMAWALSQVFVVSSEGVGDDEYSEMWLNYYDIFVRSAFKSFFDVLRAVTYSPVMGKYLTHWYSSSYDYSGTLPNENFAREVMQLFTIGTDMLNPDGRAQVDGKGDVVPTYSMEHIQNFARVFTGFVQRESRNNVEATDDKNMIDPMILDVKMHDVYPKPDLHDGYLGDYYPLCADVLVEGAALGKGARFEFEGHADALLTSADALELHISSALFQAICAAPSPEEPCAFAPAVVLASTLDCVGAECSIQDKSLVKVGVHVYKYVPPPCVHLFVGQEGMIQIDGEGMLVQKKDPNNVFVRWYEGARLPKGTYEASLTSEQLFSEVPSREALLAAKPRVGALEPLASDCIAGACFGDTSHVSAYRPGGPNPVDTSVIFELDGFYYKNVEHIVHVKQSPSTDGPTLAPPVTAKFRNPPVFLRSTGDDGGTRAAMSEVDSLLNHLFHHSNTPIFIGKRLIQRFTGSNPSAQYVQAVAHAFRSGSYDNMHFTGQYGDLGACLAAVLLHPEARPVVKPRQQVSYQGSLREPILKIMHVMRSMEYQDASGAPIVLRELQNLVGQFPYHSPTVFNYYLANYELPMPKPQPKPEPEPELEAEPEPEPEPELEAEPEAEPEREKEAEPEPEKEAEPEPEPEPEPEHEQAPVAPEFQIFTPAYFIGFLNGMSSLIKTGASYDCNSGESFGVRTRIVENNQWRDICPQGALTLQSDSGVISELDLLLTGGRLSPVSRAVVQRAYDNAFEGEKVQAAQQAVVMTAEFNTLGAPLPVGGTRPPTIPEDTGERPYMAAIMLFLAGGADTFNLLVPRCELYTEYTTVRTDLALEPREMIEISTAEQACDRFGVHGSFSFLKSLYDKGQAAFISNVGNLAEPITKDQYRSRSKQRCFGLFSHSDQQTGAQTLQCQVMGTSPKGTGGRIADALAEGNAKFSTTSFSMAGTSVWPLGYRTKREIVDDGGALGRSGFFEYETWRSSIGNITAQRHGNVYSEAYAQAFRDAIETTENVGKLLSSVTLKTTYRTNSRLERELFQVAQLIAARGARGAERDFFFVSIGGWDMHSNMKNNLRVRFLEIDQALQGFVAEMEAQGVWDGIIFVTESEFARTLDSNGGGSDHAWAGNHFMIGGGVKGGRVFNKFPASLVLGNKNDLGRGRMIPEFPWESVMVPIAEKMGVKPEQLATVFPNLGKFNATTQIIQTNELFHEAS